VQQKPSKSSISLCRPDIWRRSLDAVVELETRILAKNDALAAKNRAWFAGREIRALNDGERIPAAGAPAVQVNAGTGGHLEADVVARDLAELKPAPDSAVMIENVANLVCPAMFDQGISCLGP
jgi:hydrogenase nickel incorporation protein HypB